MEEPNVLNDQVAICLHLHALHVGTLLSGILPDKLALAVHSNLAIVLHFELIFVVLTPQAVAGEQPLFATEGVVGSRHIE